MQRTAKSVVSLVPAPVRSWRRASEWARLVEGWRASGQSVEAYATRIGVRPKTLARWVAELSRRARVSRPTAVPPPSVTFLPVAVRRSASAASAPSVVAQVLVGSFTVQVMPGAEAAQVVELCHALRSETPC